MCTQNKNMGENNDENNIDMDTNDGHNDEEEIVFDDDIDEDGKKMHSVKKVRDKLKACEDEKKEYLDGQRLSSFKKYCVYLYEELIF